MTKKNHKLLQIKMAIRLQTVHDEAYKLNTQQQFCDKSFLCVYYVQEEMSFLRLLQMPIYQILDHLLLQ